MGEAVASSSSPSSSSSASYSMEILHSGDPVSRPRSWENPGTSSSPSLPSPCSTFIAAMYSYSYSVSISHAWSGIFSRGIFRDITTKTYLMALRTDQKWSRVLGPGVVECKRPLPEEPSAPISHTDPPYIASAITCDMFQLHAMHWRLLHLNLLHRIHLKVLQSTIRLVGPQ